MEEKLGKLLRQKKKKTFCFRERREGGEAGLCLLPPACSKIKIMKAINDHEHGRGWCLKP